jgi:hypothetical protein
LPGNRGDLGDAVEVLSSTRQLKRTCWSAKALHLSRLSVYWMKGCLRVKFLTSVMNWSNATKFPVSELIWHMVARETLLGLVCLGLA